MTAPVVRLSSVSVRRDPVEVLKGVDWQIAPGENWVLLGANGSGKTSLLNVLMAYSPATQGSVEILGKCYGRYDWRELRKRVGLVGPSISAYMPAAEPAERVVESGSEAMIGSFSERNAKTRERARELLERIECSNLVGRPWRVLSQGERQRLMIGRALIAEPTLLILDEPCAGLDPAAREGFVAFLERLATQPDAPTLVLVTHHVEEISAAFSHALVLKGGRVLAQGSISEVLTHSVLSSAFGRPVAVQRDGSRYSLSFTSDPDRIV